MSELKREFVLGIDPGMTGAAVLINRDMSKIYTIKSHPSPREFLDWTMQINGDIVEAYIEELSGRPGDTPTTAFALGTSYGIWQMFARSVFEDLQFIRPQVWQTRFVRSMTDGAVRYLPNEYSKRKQYVWELVKESIQSSCFKYAADAVAIAYVAIQEY